MMVVLQLVQHFMKTLYLGPEYDLSHIEGDRCTFMDVAKLIDEKNTVAIFQGRSEAGPRALGNRSILYDPRDPEAKEKMNAIKGRESFRPFAATVLQESAKDWFDLAGMEETPSMMYACDALKDTQNIIPGVLHFNTCRIQTLTREQNPLYYDVIRAFYKYVKVPMVFNTSFNKAGEPLVETPQDALDTFYSTDIKVLYFPEIRRAIVKPFEEP